MRSASNEISLSVQPEISGLAFDLHEILSEVRGLFAEAPTWQLDVYFIEQKTLACIITNSSPKMIRLHSVLNHAQTPEKVIRFILGHELLHLVHPPREVDGRWTKHPPEFFEAEDLLFPVRSWVFCWIWTALHSCLHNDEKNERILVKKCWKRLMSHGRISLSDLKNIYAPEFNGVEMQHRLL